MSELWHLGRRKYWNKILLRLYFIFLGWVVPIAENGAGSLSDNGNGEIVMTAIIAVYEFKELISMFVLGSNNSRTTLSHSHTTKQQASE